MAAPPAAEPEPGLPPNRAVDPVHVAVLIACALLLGGIALHYYGVL